MEAQQKKILAIAVVAILVIAAVAGVLIVNNNNNNSSDTSKYANMSWDDIKKEASGQTVTLGQYPDATLKEWYDKFFIPYMKNTYNITVVINGAKYGDNGANQIVADYEAGATPTIDAFWGAISGYSILLDNSSGKNLNFMDNWVSYLPNSKYLPSSDFDVAKSTYQYVTGNDWSKGKGSTMPFSSGMSAMVYNPDFNDPDLPYNIVKIGGDKYVKVQADTYDSEGKYVSTGFYGDSTQVKGSVADAQSGDSFNISEVRWVYLADHSSDKTIKDKSGVEHEVTTNSKLVYGMPDDFTEMLAWAAIYNQQMTYASPTSTGAWFHGYMFVQSVMYELCWKNQDSNSGAWDVASKYTWKNESGKECSYSEYLNEKLTKLPNALSSSSQRDYYNIVGYAYLYLKQLETYCNKAIGHNYAWISAQTGHLLGTAGYTAEGDVKMSIAPVSVAGSTSCTVKSPTYTDQTVMISWSSVSSLAMRSGSYTTNFGVTMLKTSVCDTYYWCINKESKNIAGTLVVLNELLNPEIQSAWYYCNGNDCNIDVNLYVDNNGNIVDKGTSGAKTIWDKYFEPKIQNGFEWNDYKVHIAGWKDSTKYIDRETVQKNTITDYMVAWNMYLGNQWHKTLG